MQSKGTGEKLCHWFERKTCPISQKSKTCWQLPATCLLQNGWHVVPLPANQFGHHQSKQHIGSCSSLCTRCWCIVYLCELQANGPLECNKCSVRDRWIQYIEQTISIVSLMCQVDIMKPLELRKEPWPILGERDLFKPWLACSSLLCCSHILTQQSAPPCCPSLIKMMQSGDLGGVELLEVSKAVGSEFIPSWMLWPQTVHLCNFSDTQ